MQKLSSTPVRGVPRSETPPASVTVMTTTSCPVKQTKKATRFPGFCGILGGSAGILVTHPIDTVRVRVILQRKPFFSLMKELFRNNGVAGFFSGVIPPVVIRGMAFGANRWFYSKGKQMSDTYFIQGCIAGIPNSIIECPMHFLKIRSQVLDGQKRNPEKLSFYIRHSFDIIRNHGLRAYFRGYLCNAFVMIPGFGFFYVAYEPLKNMGLSPFVASILAVPVTWLPVYPLEVLRSHYQTDLKLSYSTAFKRMFQPFQIAKCFPGITTTLNRAILRFAVAMSVTEKLEQLV